MALEETSCFGQDETFDRLSQLVAKAVQSSAAFVSLADCGADEIVFAGLTGLPEIPPGERTNLSRTICRHVVSSGEPLVIPDTQAHPLARDEALIRTLGIGAYLGVPLATAEGELVGVLCSVDRHAREWTPAHVEIAEGLAAAVMTEIGLRRSMELAARQAEERATILESLRQSQKMEAIGQLAGGIAHDFNNMLTAISGYAELLACSFDEGDPRAEDVEQIRKATAHAAALTRQLLTFSRKQVLLPQRLNVNDVVRDLAPMLSRTIGAEVELKTSLETDPAFVETDPDQLAQIVLNIAINGRDAMPGGGVLTIATKTDESETGRFVAIEIADTGVGMDDETRNRVFEPFFTTKETGKGTGLGLATAYGVVNQSGGRIEIDTAPGEGSTFRVLLPAA